MSSTSLKHEDFHVLGADLHSHLIPGVDDGAKDMEESITGIRKLHEIGFDTIITTPHIMPGYYNNNEDDLLRKAEDVIREIEKQNIDVKFKVAAEYFCDENFVQKIKNTNLLTLGNDFFLFELPFFNKPVNFDEVVFAIQSKGLKPILAHIERYSFFHELPMDDFHELSEKGLNIQVNIGSFSGAYGPIVKLFAERLAKEKLIDFLASDYHHIKHISQLYKSLKNKHVQQLLEQNELKNHLLI
ncbi:MAG: capsular biosynthesis protein [Chitinophagaceae bacterium]|nr:MAG: capsular biosynthesis protein [Chitinophagaceae bacterium]